jgi:hypothetical protein
VVTSLERFPVLISAHQVATAQEDLNDPDVNVLLEKMRGETVTQGMGRHALADDRFGARYVIPIGTLITAAGAILFGLGSASSVFIAPSSPAAHPLGADAHTWPEARDRRSRL